MKKICIVILSFSFGVLSQTLAQDSVRVSREKPTPGDTATFISPTVRAPDFVAYDLQGNKIDSRDLRGNIVVLDFWATWCKPCREAFPQLEKIYEQQKLNTGIKFLAINAKNSGDSPNDVKQFIADSGYTFPFALDKSDVTGDFSITEIPTTIIIDQQGMVAYRSKGYMTPDEYRSTITSAIEALLKR
jgi:thiol-disulfide isomerase/thioredoxin